MSKNRKNVLREQGVTPALAKQFAAASKKDKGITVKSIKKPN